jgi:hypothetical protein
MGMKPARRFFLKQMAAGHVIPLEESIIVWL